MGFSGVTKKKASPRITYTASNWTPFSQSERPSPATWPVINTESSTASTSPAENARSIGAGPMTKLASTSTGATNSATWMLEPIAIESERSMRFFKAAETAAGYAKEMSADYQAKQAALVAEHIKRQDIVVTTALIPGRPAPKLVSAAQVASMRPGSVIVDLAVEQGGNVEGAKAGEVVDIDGVKIVGYTNVAGRVAASASGLYARNLFSFIETMIDKAKKKLAVNWDDELVKATALTRDSAVIHPNFQPKA